MGRGDRRHETLRLVISDPVDRENRRPMSPRSLPLGSSSRLPHRHAREGHPNEGRPDQCISSIPPPEAKNEGSLSGETEDQGGGNWEI